MAERLKRWESPRRQGRNDKGRGGSARQRQLRKQQQMLRKKLKPDSDHKKQIRDKEDKLNYLPLIFFRGVFLTGVMMFTNKLYPFSKFKLHLLVGVNGR